MQAPEEQAADEQVPEEPEDEIVAIVEAADVDAELDFEIEPKYYQDNFEFMNEFIQTYTEDSAKAKAAYYLQKLKFNVNSETGKAELKKLLTRYLQGLQWVLYYYYTGVKHWRWYYPYHYAPMISDLGTDIVNQFLGGKNVIDAFPVDSNCSEDPSPYTPFQQLMCILPIKSLKLTLPNEYVSLA